MKNNIDECPVRKSLSILGGKWKLLIIYQLSEHDYLRYGDLKRSIPEISEKMLNQELKNLMANSIVEKKVHVEVPPRVEYFLTEKGKEAQPIISLLQRFGSK